jgi:hypothetical protein
MTGCGADVNAPDRDANRVVLNNDEIALAGRVKYTDESVDLQQTDPTFANLPKTTGNIELILRATVEPPAVDGYKLHASHVTFSDGHAYVSYSTINNDYRGGVEIFDVKNPRYPRLKSQALFRDTDITIAVEFLGRLFMGEATDSDHDSRFSSPACLEVFELERHRMRGIVKRIDLPSYNANDLHCCDNAIFVTTGTTDGMLSIFDQHELTVAKQLPIDGAKAIAKTSRFFVVLEGTGKSLHLIDRQSREYVKMIDLGCSNYFQSKAEIAIHDDKAYLSAWQCGVKVVDLDEETVEDVLPAPPDGQTNGVSIENGIIYIANGKHGLLIARIERSGLTILGRAEFDGSTNFVAARENQIFVAHGTGGLSILELIFH